MKDAALSASMVKRTRTRARRVRIPGGSIMLEPEPLNRINERRMKKGQVRVRVRFDRMRN